MQTTLRSSPARVARAATRWQPYSPARSTPSPEQQTSQTSASGTNTTPPRGRTTCHTLDQARSTSQRSSSHSQDRNMIGKPCTSWLTNGKILMLTYSCRTGRPSPYRDMGTIHGSSHRLLAGGAQSGRAASERRRRHTYADTQLRVSHPAPVAHDLGRAAVGDVLYRRRARQAAGARSARGRAHRSGRSSCQSFAALAHHRQHIPARHGLAQPRRLCTLSQPSSRTSLPKRSCRPSQGGASCKEVCLLLLNTLKLPRQ